MLLLAGILILWPIWAGPLFVASGYQFRVSPMLLSMLGGGSIVLTAGILMYTLPRYHVIWGVLGVISSLFSIVGSGGFVGFGIFGIIGGVFGIAWKPKPQQTPTP